MDTLTKLLSDHTKQHRSLLGWYPTGNHFPLMQKWSCQECEGQVVPIWYCALIVDFTGLVLSPTISLRFVVNSVAFSTDETGNHWRSTDDNTLTFFFAFFFKQSIEKRVIHITVHFFLCIFCVVSFSVFFFALNSQNLLQMYQNSGKL